MDLHRDQDQGLDRTPRNGSDEAALERSPGGDGRADGNPAVTGNTGTTGSEYIMAGELTLSEAVRFRVHAIGPRASEQVAIVTSNGDEYDHRRRARGPASPGSILLASFLER